MTHDEAKALTYGTTIYHKTLHNADGSMVRARVNGKVRLWKRRPDYYEVPMKHGLRDCFYLTPDRANDWSVTDTLGEERDRIGKAKRRAAWCKQIELTDDVPDGILYDALQERLGWSPELARIVAFAGH